jgi:hypothetical protein
MARPFPSVSSKLDANRRFGVLEFEPLLNGIRVRDFHLLHISFLACLSKIINSETMWPGERHAQ